MATPYMNLELPTPSITTGPEWADFLNTSLETIDEHDHTSGKGIPIPSAGLDINADLNINNYRLIGAKSYKLTSQVASLSGATHANSLYSDNGDLYFVNSGGVGVQITDGSTISAVPTTFDSYVLQEVATNLTIGASDPFVFLNVSTVAARAISLPTAASVSPGRTYIIKDKSGLSRTNNITISTTGGDLLDGATSQVLNSNYGSWSVTSDGVSAWSIY